MCQAGPRKCAIRNVRRPNHLARRPDRLGSWIFYL